MQEKSEFIFVLAISTPASIESRYGNHHKKGDEECKSGA
jgi:hypothetical protein